MTNTKKHLLVAALGGLFTFTVLYFVKGHAAEKSGELYVVTHYDHGSEHTSISPAEPERYATDGALTWVDNRGDKWYAVSGLVMVHQGGDVKSNKTQTDVKK